MMSARRLGFIVLGTFLAWSLPASAGNYMQLQSFTGGSDGSGPLAGLTPLAGVLYGTTSVGGSFNAGTIYEINPVTGSKSTIYSFQGGADGLYPNALLAVKGTLYGTTLEGGSGSCPFGCGTIFSFSPQTGVEKVLYSFTNSPDGAQPYGDLLLVGRALVGTTAYGGTAGFNTFGTVFSFGLDTEMETVIHRFQNEADGGNPVSGLTPLGSLLYGTTTQGGLGGCGIAIGCGTIYSIDPKTGSEAVVHAFAGNDGVNPQGGLLNVSGVLYGTTSYGGAAGNGVIFSLDPATSSFALRYSFVGGEQDAANPQARLTLVGRTLYGTGAGGGSNSYPGFGAVFSFSLSSGLESDVYKFQGSPDGSFPAAPLLFFKHALYGTTGAGGSTECDLGCGTVFRISR
jgi:uncharacterized repeat protein (TIGR03803 family)